MSLEGASPLQQSLIDALEDRLQSFQEARLLLPLTRDRSIVKWYEYYVALQTFIELDQSFRLHRGYSTEPAEQFLLNLPREPSEGEYFTAQNLHSLGDLPLWLRSYAEDFYQALYQRDQGRLLLLQEELSSLVREVETTLSQGEQALLTLQGLVEFQVLSQVAQQSQFSLLPYLTPLFQRVIDRLLPSRIILPLSF